MTQHERNSKSAIRAAVDAAVHTVRRDAVMSIALLLLAVIPFIILLSWAVGGWSRPSVMPLVLEVAALAAACVTWVRVRRSLHRTVNENAVAREAEAKLSLAAGSVRGALELDHTMPSGSSAALAERSARELSGHFASVQPVDLTGTLGMRWRTRRRGAFATFAILVIAVFAAGFATPARSRAAWSPLLHPVRNLKAPALAPLDVRPGNASVTRGGAVDVHIRAASRAVVNVHWHMQGDIVRDSIIAVLGDTAAFAIGHVDGSTEYWVDAPDGATSPRYTITPVDALLLSQLAVDVIYPAYLGMAAEHYDGEVPALELPQGTELILRGRATRSLKDASLHPDSGAAVPLSVDGSAFSSRWVPRESGVWQWQMSDTGGNTLAVEPPPIALTIVQDAAPSAEITFPATDTVFGAELTLPVTATASDDHGIAAAWLVTWRVSRTGVREPEVATPLPIVAADRVAMETVIDAGARNLSAGDTLHYLVRVRDNSPSGQTTDSRAFRVTIPGMSQLRSAAETQADALMKANAELARTAARLQEETRNTQRRTSAVNAARSGANGGDPAQQQNRMQFSESRDAQKILDQQRELMQNMDEMRAKVESLEKSVQNAGLQDTDLQKKLDELRKLYEQALTPEMKQKLDQLNAALQKLDSKEVEKSLQQLAQEQEQLRQQLERSMDLMRRAAAEQQMNRLTEETRDLARQQDALASAANEKNPKEAAAQQADLAKKNDALSKEMDALRDQLAKQGEQQAAKQTDAAAAQTKAAQQSMQDAARAAEPADAQKDAQDAARKLDDAAKQLDQARKQMVDGWKEETQQSMAQATRDALDLAQRQQALKEQMEKGTSSTPRPPVPQPQIGKSSDAGKSQPAPGAQPGNKPQNGNSGRAGGAGGDQQSGSKDGGRQGSPPTGTSGTPQPGGNAGQPQSQGAPDLNAMRSEQAALQQGLEQLSRNLQETGDRSAQVSRDVSSSLDRASQSMQQTQNALQNATPDGQLPSDQAGQTVDALNKLALSLLKNSQSVQQSQNGTGMQQAMEQMGELARQQGSLNGQGSSLMPMNLGPAAMSEQVRKLGASQQQIAQQLGNMAKAPSKDMLGSVDELAKEAASLAQEMQSGRLEPQTLARQEKLFHRMLDAGRSLEKDETSQERVGEKPSNARTSQPGALDPTLFQDRTRFRAPTQEELNALPPAYRKLILEYFERLNRTPSADHTR